MLAGSNLAICSQIHEAAKNGDLVKVEALLKKHPDLVFSKDKQYGETPLHLAAEAGHKDVAELLLVNNADANAKNKVGETPLHEAAFGAYIVGPDSNLNDVAKLLLAHKAEVNAKDIYGRTPLHEAAEAGHKVVVELLLANNAEVNATNNDGWTPLHCAARCGHKVVAALLIANNAEVNAKDKYGDTPLHAAAEAGHKDVVELLLANKANVNATNNYGSTPSDLVKDSEHNDVALLLLAQGRQASALENSNKLATLKTYIAGKTTRQLFLNDNWNGKDPFFQVIGVVGFKLQNPGSGPSFYILGTYPPSVIESIGPLTYVIPFCDNAIPLSEQFGVGDFPPYRRFKDKLKTSWDITVPLAAVETCTIYFTNDVLQSVVYPIH